jgi:hypothetical protein
MAVKFQSQVSGDLLMLQVHAQALLKVLGKDENGPGILRVEDMPAALQALRALSDEVPKPPEVETGEEPLAFQEEPVSLRKRAVPLIKMIETAMAADKPIVWGV